jgi:hypothetical protein
MVGGQAGRDMQAFVDEVRGAHDDVAPLINQISALPPTASISPDVQAGSERAAARFRRVVGWFGAAPDASLQHSVVDVVFALGQELSPFLAAAGWSPADWSQWQPLIEDGRINLALSVAHLAEVVALHPEVRPSSSQSLATAAFVGGLSLLTERGFGQTNFTVQPQWSLQWLGGPPPDTSSGVARCIDDSASPAVPAWRGPALDGVGGCAILWTDTIDPDVHREEVEQWLIDPAQPLLGGELVLITQADAQWVAVGAAE